MKFDAHIRHKLRSELLELEEDPSEKGGLLQGLSRGLRYKKIFHAGVHIGQYMIFQKIKNKF
jgi:hypothetical protein